MFCGVEWRLFCMTLSKSSAPRILSMTADVLSRPRECDVMRPNEHTYASIDETRSLTTLHGEVSCSLNAATWYLHGACILHVFHCLSISKFEKFTPLYLLEEDKNIQSTQGYKLAGIGLDCKSGKAQPGSLGDVDQLIFEYKVQVSRATFLIYAV